MANIAPDLPHLKFYAKAAIGLVTVAAVVASVVAAPGIIGILGGVLAVLMVAIAVVDARRFIIPNKLTATALVHALGHAAVGEADALEAVVSAAARCVVLALIFLAIREIYGRLRQREGLGLGDIKLAGVAGAWLSWSTIPIAVEIAALAGLAYYASRQILAGRPVRLTGRLPFGLFFAPAIWLGWLIQTLLDGL